jgi:DNA replication and repair protein RecF
LIGQNAQGKTSLLESIYYLATSSSPYTNSDRQLMNWRVLDDYMPFMQVGAEVLSADRTLNRVEITLLREKMPDGSERYRKEVRINGVTKRNLDLLGMIAVVMFLPQDLSLVEGGPSLRRRYLDLTLGQTDGDYTEARNQFEKTLSQRNALLRRIASNQASSEELSFWDEQLAQNAAILIAARQQCVRDLEYLAQDIHRELSGGSEDLELHYQPSFEPTAEGDGQQSFNMLGLDLHRQLGAEHIAPQYQAALLENRAEEIQRGMTLLGPQRDDMRFMVNNRDLSLYGSRGQARTAIMALKLAELQWMQKTLGESPVLLLDEVVAELDAHRRAYLLDHIKSVNQVLMTTTEPSVLADEFLQTATLWQVEMGQIISSTTADA